METGGIDGQYYQIAKPQSLSERIVIAARDRIYADFIRLCNPAPGATLLDIGVSDAVTDAANVLERLYPHPENITAAGLGAGNDFVRSYPRVAYIQIEAGKRLPFPDKVFDFAVSNAVLEHVGSVEEQSRFIAEHIRVAKSVFITVPNRFFPVEHHTAIPFAHYNDQLFAFACNITNKQEWARAENLILMSKRRLVALCPRESHARIGYTGLPMGPFSSNLYLHISS